MRIKPPAKTRLLSRVRRMDSLATISECIRTLEQNAAQRFWRRLMATNKQMGEWFWMTPENGKTFSRRHSGRAARIPEYIEWWRLRNWDAD